MSTQVPVSDLLSKLSSLADVFSKVGETFSVKFDGENFIFAYRPDWADEDAELKINRYWTGQVVQCVEDFEKILPSRITFGTFWTLLESVNHGYYEDKAIWLTQQVSYYLQNYRKDYDSVAVAVSLNARRGYEVKMLRFDGVATAQAIANAVAKGGHFSLFDGGDTVIVSAPKD